MSIPITISGTVISFPSSSESPSWAEAVIQFAQAVETALSASAGAYDVAPQVFNIDGSSFNPTASPTNVPNLSFSTTAVRAVMINIATKRTNGVTTVAEETQLFAVYNGTIWEMSRETTGDASITFTITPDGQVQFATVMLTGTQVGILSYSAKALLNS